MVNINYVKYSIVITFIKLIIKVDAVKDMILT